MLSRQGLIELYRRRAKRYDFTANLYYLVGFREWSYRKKAVSALDLSCGDTVIEIGCGTGLNFELLQQKVGSEGKIIGVDLTDAMLRQAQARIDDNGWTNVELVECDASTYVFPAGVDGILSTFALTLVPEFDAVIEHGAVALREGKRWVVADLKMPSNFFRHLCFALDVNGGFNEVIALTHAFSENVDSRKTTTLRGLTRYADCRTGSAASSH